MSYRGKQKGNYGARTRKANIQLKKDLKNSLPDELHDAKKYAQFAHEAKVAGRLEDAELLTEISGQEMNHRKIDEQILEKSDVPSKTPFSLKGWRVQYIDKDIRGDGKGDGYSGMNWFAALALGIDYPYSQKTILVRHGTGEWLKEHEVREARKLKPVYEKKRAQKETLTREDYYNAHAATLVEMGDTAPWSLEKNEVPYVRTKVKELEKGQY